MTKRLTRRQKEIEANKRRAEEYSLGEQYVEVDELPPRTMTQREAEARFWGPLAQPKRKDEDQ